MWEVFIPKIQNSIFPQEFRPARYLLSICGYLFEQAAENKIEAFSLQEQAVNVILTS